MGGAQSSPQSALAAAPLKSKDVERIELFSTVFLRLLKTADILDIRALTKGPGACGDYTILLANEIEKEFGKIKLEGTDSGKTAIRDFLFARSKTISSESPSDQVACRSLAVFYIRALQLVAALTMSIYTPPDLVNRIRNRVFQMELKRQRKNVPLTLVEAEELRIKREKWWARFLMSTSKPDIFTLTGSNQYRYNRVTKMLTYTDPETQYEYKVQVAVLDLEKYNIAPELMREGSYWIELYNPTTREPIFRSLINSDKSGYLFDVKPADSKEEKPVIFNKDWTTELAAQITAGVTGTAPPPKPTTNASRRNNSRYYNSVYRSHGGGPYNFNNNLQGRRNSTRKNAPRTNTPVDPSKQEEIALQLAATATLPRPFQESYKAMVRWTLDISTWTEAAPASYRAVLLFIKPTLPAGQAASYICVDNWIDKPMRFIQPFAALEALYFNKDDGSATPENKTALKDLVTRFNGIYHAVPTAGQTAAKEPSTLEDVYLPNINDAIKNTLCSKRTAQGDIMIPDPRVAAILESGQLAILNSYKSHFENAYAILNELFTTVKTETGETKVRFADKFVANTGSARTVLEEIIRRARSMIAAHYVDVEEIYSKILNELAKPRV
jgi:hypothetical protein